MEQDPQSLRQYAWNYVSFYGGQRARLLLAFAAVGSGVTLGAAGLLRTEATEIVVAPLGVLLMVLGVLFWIVNRGLSAKVQHGEEALRHLDAELKLPNVKGGAPHVLRLLEQGGGDGATASKCCGCDASTLGSAVYILFALLGFFFAMAPFYPKEMAVAPIVIETPAPLVKATPHRLPPNFGRPTPDFNQRRFPGSTPFPGGPSRLNNFPGRPPGSMPQPGVPAGMPPRFVPPTGAAPAGAVPAGGAPNGALQPGSFPGGAQPGRPAIVPAAPATVHPAPAPPAAVPAAPAVTDPATPAAATSPAQPPVGKQ